MTKKRIRKQLDKIYRLHLPVIYYYIWYSSKDNDEFDMYYKIGIRQ